MSPQQRLLQKIIEKSFSLLNNFLYTPKVSSYTTVSGPLVSLIMPVFNPNFLHLKTAIESVIDQTYQNWELVIINDASTDPRIKPTLKLFSYHPKIKIIHNTRNLNIVAATNIGIKQSRGDYVGFFDHDDYLFPQALSVISDSLNDIVYTDEDKIIKNHHYHPFCKPNYSQTLLSQVNYINHLTIFKKTLLQKLKYLRPHTDGAQDWDLLLRASKIIRPQNITHIPQILYSWRSTTTSTASTRGIKNSKYLPIQKTILEYNFPNSTITSSRYLGIWSINHQPTVLPYQLELQTFKRLVSRSGQ